MRKEKFTDARKQSAAPGSGTRGAVPGRNRTDVIGTDVRVYVCMLDREQDSTVYWLVVVMVMAFSNYNNLGDTNLCSLRTPNTRLLKSMIYTLKQEEIEIIQK